MRILRVEHPVSLQGPYTHGEDSLNCIAHSYSRISNPEPEEDGLRGVQGWCFGFMDTDQLTDWFSRRALHLLITQCSFVVAEYEVPERYAKLGGHQVAFLREYATKVGEVEFTK